MCLKLLPIIEGDLPELTKREMRKVINSNIKFQVADKDEVANINESTFQTSNELLISETHSLLQRYLKT
mgnify:FL=1|tara:strand:+ start:1137 stop:1343 length:207 start_codon:yes stop_codon:yes gene_type:complete